MFEHHGIKRKIVNAGRRIDNDGKADVLRHYLVKELKQFVRHTTDWRLELKF